MNSIVKSLKSIAEPIRIRILLLLIDREACVCELMAVFDMAQSKLSHHLIILREAGFLRCEKRGRWNYYRMDTKTLRQVNREMIFSLCRWMIDESIIERDKAILEKVSERMRICC